eukprot:2255621-Amphidinium_carterae.1
MEDEAPLTELQDTPTPVSSKRDLTQMGYQRRSSNPAAYPQWTQGQNKIGSIPEDKPHPDWHHPANNLTPDRAAGEASGSGQNPRPSHPIYMAHAESQHTPVEVPMVALLVINIVLTLCYVQTLQGSPVIPSNEVPVPTNAPASAHNLASIE